MTSIRFALRKGATSTLYQLQLLVRQRPLIQWALPATLGHSAGCLPARGLLVEAQPLEVLPELLQQGYCQLADEQLPSTCSSLRAALAKGRLLLTFSGPQLQGTYSLIRLHGTSPAWLLSKVSYLLPQQPAAQGRARRQTATATLHQVTGVA